MSVSDADSWPYTHPEAGTEPVCGTKTDADNMPLCAGIVPRCKKPNLRLYRSLFLSAAGASNYTGLRIAISQSN